jgi:hypothetical protein
MLILWAFADAKNISRFGLLANRGSLGKVGAVISCPAAMMFCMSMMDADGIEINALCLLFILFQQR